MALSLLKYLCLSILLLWVDFGNARTVTYNGNERIITYNFTAGWVTRNPDGMFERQTMGINGQWPLPPIEVTMKDRLVVYLHNDLGDQDVSLHFHGLFQNGTNYMDGPVGVTQCGVPPGKSITYNFTIEQPGTYWYHSHVRGQYPDGLRGPMLVTDPNAPYKWDEEVVMTLSDWYHEQMPVLLSRFISPANPTGAEPVPNAALIGDTQNKTFKFEQGTSYFFRIINMAAFAAQYLWFEGHTMQIIEVDGVWTEMQPAHMIYLAPAQRYGVIIKAHDTADENFAIVGHMDESLFDVVPPGLNTNVSAFIVYNEKKPLPTPKKVQSLHAFDDFTLVPVDGEPIFENPSQTLTITMKMDNLGDGANYAFINGVTYVAPKVPTLYTTMSTGVHAADERIYAENTNAFVLQHNEVIEIRFNNHDPGKHPFHLHGHNFQTVYRSPPNEHDFNATAHPSSTFRKIPMRRDTFLANPNGNFVIRFRSDNPGIWLYHCHLEWHIDSGLVATMVEAPMQMQERLSVPEEHYQLCKDQGLPVAGNAAGNTQDVFNLEGANKSPPPLPAGFTARGIVALVFSCISAVLGMAVIGWYGVKPIGKSEFAAARERIAKAKI